MQKLEHYIGLRENISQDLLPIGYQAAYNFINFMYSCFQPAFCFYWPLFVRFFLTWPAMPAKIQQKAAQYKAKIQTES